MAEPPPPPAGLPGQAPALDPQAGQIPPPSGGPIPAAALQPAPPLPVVAPSRRPPPRACRRRPCSWPCPRRRRRRPARRRRPPRRRLRRHMAQRRSMPDASRGSGENTFVAGHVRIQRPRSAHGTNHLARICGSLRAFCPTSDSAEIGGVTERDAAAATARHETPSSRKRRPGREGLSHLTGRFVAASSFLAHPQRTLHDHHERESAPPSTKNSPKQSTRAGTTARSVKV